MGKENRLVGDEPAGVPDVCVCFNLFLVVVVCF